jgi:hypothetical protein
MPDVDVAGNEIIMITSMTREAKKQEELHLVEQMRRLRGGNPEGKLEAVGEPDVCVVGPAHRLGIEVTELHQRPKPGAPPRRLVESERGRMVALAGALAASAGIPPLDVAVHFTDRAAIGKGNREQAARRLAALVSNNLPDNDQIWRS